MSKRVPLEERFWSKVEKTDTCWNWTSATHRDGHGVFWIGKGVSHFAHRVVLKISGIIIPDRMVVDHVCRNRRCVNPGHLRIVTPKVNALENSHSICVGLKNLTHCKRGHLLSEDNLVQGACRAKARICKTCQRLRSRKYYLASK